MRNPPFAYGLGVFLSVRGESLQFRGAKVAFEQRERDAFR